MNYIKENKVIILNVFFIDKDIESIADPLSMKAYNSLYDLNNILRINIKLLTKKQRRRLYMKYYLNMSNVKIARMENVSEGAIRKSIMQSINKLRRKLFKYIY